MDESNNILKGIISFNSNDESVHIDKKYFVLIIYDITENKRRNNMVKVLKSYGFRVQKSAFEAILKPQKYLKLIESIKNIPESCDSLRIYKLYGQASVEVYGTEYMIEDEDVIII